jgi:hypothetical protein
MAKKDRSPLTLARLAEAEIGRLKARIAQLEAEVTRLGGSLVPPAPAPLIDQPGIARGDAKKKTTRGVEAAIKADRRERELREAVKAADRAVMDAWHEGGRERVIAEGGDLLKALGSVQAKARAAAREEVRARWAAEDAEGRIEYPAHITRLSNEKAGA